MLSDSAIQALLVQLNEPYSCYRHADDTQRMRRAAEVIETLISHNHALHLQLEAFRSELNKRGTL